MMEADVRFLARVEELSPGYARARLLHCIVNHSMDLKPLDSVITVAVSPRAYDDLAVLYSAGQPAVIDIEQGEVVRASSVQEAGVRPAQKVVLRLEEGLLNTYAVVYTARRYFNPLKQALISMRYHWAHELGEHKHQVHIKDAVQFDNSHCTECASVRLLRKVACSECTAAGHIWLWNVESELLAMVKLAFGRASASGSFTASADDQGRMQIQTKTAILSTNIYDIQRLLERAITGGR